VLANGQAGVVLQGATGCQFVHKTAQGWTAGVFADVSLLLLLTLGFHELQLLESKESRYLEQLAVTFDQHGVSFDPAVLYSPPAPGDDAAAAAAQQLLESQDIVAWVPKKKMMVSWIGQLHSMVTVDVQLTKQ
jgi:hypothetical protein